MIAWWRRQAFFQASAGLLGVRWSKRLSTKWRAVLADRDLVADLVELAQMREAPVDAQGRALSGDELQRRAGASQLVLALFARASITSDDINEAIEDMNDGTHGTFALDADGDDPFAGR